jgi:hypothetical protein
VQNRVLRPAEVRQPAVAPVLTPMNCANQRRCDICEEVIPLGTLYRVGRVTADELESWCEDTPEFVPPFTEEEDGLLRFDVCTTCTIASPGIELLTEPTVDVLG